jgi:hypothetical protein
MLETICAAVAFLSGFWLSELMRKKNAPQNGSEAV